MKIGDIVSIDFIKKEVETILKDFDNVGCYLFGSYARGTPTIYSDIDLLLLFARDRYSYTLICEIKKKIKDNFEKYDKYCDPIYGFIDKINDDSSILFRQYINYGLQLSKFDIRSIMKKETTEELRRLEYLNYWKPMYIKKLEILKVIIENDIELNDSVLPWQHLFLVLYWNAKAKLTLIDRQYSLNEFSLLYIYTELLKITLTLDEEYTLECVQKQRDDFKNFEYFSKPRISFLHSFKLTSEIINKTDKEYDESKYLYIPHF